MFISRSFMAILLFSVTSFPRHVAAFPRSPLRHIIINSPSARFMSIASNYQSVLERVKKATPPGQSVRLVAVSKTKPLEDLQAAYNAGCRVFGENYAQELVVKVPEMPDDCSWHYIGSLQSNKVNAIVKAVVPASRLTIETVSSIKLAQKLNHAVAEGERLNVMVQINTSGEDSKSGVEPSEATDLCRFIVTECPQLQLTGLMTIGAVGDSSCFDVLRQCRETVQRELGMEETLELSMGMSGDFEEAIAAGATNVRVGSTIFGERDYSKDK
ncbi:PLP dependent protein [Fistulifera solaris]|uniref:Pyridoxal phosphate homeostasis protein n=1 Tax=Fistulifera solaris TaxID=1519565 RepID=A0A1Z5KMN3_FISSO|nr:PLP dependent protein [Fistulifera solaris]|eukprot:GAX27198.1 PLP dependent protein [Fistulifera solaris]